jgi:hypothetical protein
MGLLVPQQPGPLAPYGAGRDGQTYDMDFFVRYYVELELPREAVETALDELPEEWLALTADKAYARALGIMVEADSALAHELVGARVEFAIELPVRQHSVTTRSMAWALVGPGAIRPLLEADLEAGPLGPDGCQLALGGRYYVPSEVASAGIGRGMAQRLGEATIKEFLDDLANAVERLGLGIPAKQAPMLLPSAARRVKVL